MNREILFRGKRVDNGDWMCGSIISFDDGSKVILPSSAEVFMQSGTSTICCNECYDVGPSTVGQYTGLTGKNCVRIFEGDIVRYIDHDTQEYDIGEKYVADWDEEEACILFECFVYGESISYEVFNKKQAKNLEVIGNIFDNPELLKEV